MRRISQKQCREFVAKDLNKHESLQKAYKLLQVWEVY